MQEDKELVKHTAFGKAIVVNNAEELAGQDTTDSIIVTLGSDRDMVPSIENVQRLNH